MAAPVAAPERERSADDIHPLLEQQLLEAADTDGKMRLRKLLTIITRQYESFENDRTSLETVMRLASDEATAISGAGSNGKASPGCRRSSITSRTGSFPATIAAASKASTARPSASSAYASVMCCRRHWMHCCRTSRLAATSVADARRPGRGPGEHALRSRGARSGRQAPARRPDAGRSAGQQDADQATTDLHRLRARHGRALQGRGCAEGQRGSLPRTGRECA